MERSDSLDIPFWREGGVWEIDMREEWRMVIWELEIGARRWGLAQMLRWGGLGMVVCRVVRWYRWDVCMCFIK